MRTQQLGVAAAGGLPYELLSGDIREISDRTLRVLVNELRRLAEQRQWQMVIPQFCQRVINWFAEAALLNGKISAAEFDDVRRVEHAPHGWAYIHPVQDVQGKALEVENGFRSRSSVIGERGDDPEQVDDERAEDKKREGDLDLTPPPPAPVGRPPSTKQGDSDENDHGTPADDEDPPAKKG
jgi:capsid protein